MAGRCGLSIAGDRGLDHAETGKSGHVHRFGAGALGTVQPAKVMADKSPPLFETSMIGIACLSRGETGKDIRCSEVAGHRLMQGRSVRLET